MLVTYNKWLFGDDVEDFLADLDHFFHPHMKMEHIIVDGEHDEYEVCLGSVKIRFR